MKNLISTIPLMICFIWLASCSNSSTIAARETVTPTVVQPQAETVKDIPTQDQPHADAPSPSKDSTSSKKVAKQPKIGRVKELVNGDLLCYVTLVDKKGVEYNLGATFDICADSDKYLHKKVRVDYQLTSVNDCQSAEPCGKTKKESIIYKMVVLETNTPMNGTKESKTLSNGDWTITIGNSDSWSGVNGTGNLTYSGCDTKGNCIELKGGKITCRDGKCLTTWRKKDYVYVLKQDITESENSSSTLMVMKGSDVVLTAQDLKFQKQ